jgi:hypothetical protein
MSMFGRPVHAGGRRKGMAGMWSGAITLVIVAGLTCGGAGLLWAAPLSAEAETDPQLQGLSQDDWRPLGALDRVKTNDIVQVQTVQGLAGDNDIDLIYAMPDARAVTKKVNLPLAAGTSTPRFSKSVRDGRLAIAPRDVSLRFQG